MKQGITSRLSIVFSAICIFFSLNTGSYAQSRADNLEERIGKAAKDTTLVNLLVQASTESSSIDPDNAIRYAEEALILARQLHDRKAEVTAMQAMGFALSVVGNYSRAIKITLEAMQMAERESYDLGIGRTCNVIGNIYKRQGKYKEAISYFLRGKQITENNPAMVRLYSVVLSNLGDTYLDNGQTDSALYCFQTAYQVSLSNKFTTDFSLLYNRMGDLQRTLNNIPLALEYYRMGIANAVQTGKNRWLCFNYVSMAELYLQDGHTDSAIYYSLKALEPGMEKFLQQRLQAASILYGIYEKSKQNDLAIRYLKLADDIKDTLRSNIDESEIQNLLFEEKLQQMQAKEEHERAVTERKTNLQYAGMAIAIITFAVLFLLLSRSVITNTKVIVFLGILALLILYEFLNLLLHPLLDRITHHQPVIMLAILVAIAAVIIPAHHRLERWVTHKVVENNRRIRLERAKKTIQKLERQEPEDNPGPQM